MTKKENPLFQVRGESGEYEGMDIDIAQKIANALGVKLELKNDYESYNAVVDGIAKNEGDIGISKLSYTTERSKKVLFTSPYVVFKKALLINRVLLSRLDSRFTLEKIMNNASAPVVTAPGSYNDFAAALFPNAKVESCDKWETDGIQGLITGKYFAAFRDELRVRLVLRENPKAALHLVPILLKNEDDPIRMIVNKENLGLFLWLNSFIANIGDPYTIDDLFKKFEYTLEAK